MGAGDGLHLGEQVRERLGVPSVATHAAADRTDLGDRVPLDALTENTCSRITPTSAATDEGATPTPAAATDVSTGWSVNSSSWNENTDASAASSRERDSSVPCARVRNHRPA